MCSRNDTIWQKWRRYSVIYFLYYIYIAYVFSQWKTCNVLNLKIWAIFYFVPQSGLLEHGIIWDRNGIQYFCCCFLKNVKFKWNLFASSTLLEEVWNFMRESIPFENEQTRTELRLFIFYFFFISNIFILCKYLLPEF